MIRKILFAIAVGCVFQMKGQTEGVSINSDGSIPDPSAIIDVSSSSKGTLLTRMSTAERDAIVNPAQSLLIYNTTTKCFEFYEVGLWQTMACSCNPPTTPAAGSHASFETQITWNWNSVGGATGYKYNTINNYSTATDNGLSTSYTQTGLTCNTGNTLYVWAYSSCGNSAVLTLTQSTLACWNCGSNLVVSHTAGSVAPVSKTVTYGTVSSAISGSTKCWITQNLGADNQASSATDATETSAGWYWQFNRAQGFKHDGATRTPNTSWIMTINENSDWISANDPCALLIGSGWRIPTRTEWQTADGGWNSHLDGFSSVLKMHSGGRLDPSGDLQNRGNQGRSWTSTQGTSSDGWYLYYNISESDTYGANGKTSGFSLRCLKD